MKKIVINTCYGGFSLSDKAKELYKAKKELPENTIVYAFDLERDDPILIEVIEELGKNANDILSKIKIIEIPDDIDWEIDEYDGMESIHEKHRSWS